jgi:hypothetical protein
MDRSIIFMDSISHRPGTPGRMVVTSEWKSAVWRQTEIFPEPDQRICPTGKSLLIFRNRVKAWNQKYFAFAVGQIKTRTAAILFRGGASAIVTNVGMGCGGRGSVRRGRDCRAS